MAKKSRRYLLGWLSTLASLCVWAETYSFGVVPQQSAQKLAEAWQPLFDEVATRHGIELVFQTAPSIPEFETRLANGEYDFAYMNPYHYTVFSESPGYRAVAKEKDKQIRGIIVVRSDSTATSLEDLESGVIAFPAPLAFAATLVTKSHLAEANVKFTETFVRTHDSVYLNVAAGRFLAGGGVLRTFNNMPKETRDQLRVLWQSPGYTPHAIAAHPAIPDSTIGIVGTALETLHATEPGQAALNKLGMKGFVIATDSDWDDVRQLDIGRE